MVDAHTSALVYLEGQYNRLNYSQIITRVRTSGSGCIRDCRNECMQRFWRVILRSLIWSHIVFFFIWADAEKTEDGRKRAVATKGIPTNEFQPLIYVSMQGFLSTHFTVGIQPPLSQRFGKMAMPYFWVHYKCISTCFQESEDKNNTCARCSLEQSPNLIPKFSAWSAIPKSLI